MFWFFLICMSFFGFLIILINIYKRVPIFWLQQLLKVFFFGVFHSVRSCYNKQVRKSSKYKLCSIYRLIEKYINRNRLNWPVMWTEKKNQEYIIKSDTHKNKFLAIACI